MKVFLSLSTFFLTPILITLFLKLCLVMAESLFNISISMSFNHDTAISFIFLLLFASSVFSVLVYIGVDDY